MFVERSTQYTSFSSRKQPANAGTERKQFIENASVALQQAILTHVHTKCPPVACSNELFSLSGRLCFGGKPFDSLNKYEFWPLNKYISY